MPSPALVYLGAICSCVIEAFGTWSTVSVAISAAMGILYRQKHILRLSLATGICSLAASFLYSFALR